MTEIIKGAQANSTGADQKATVKSASEPPDKQATPFVPVKSKAREFSEQVVTFGHKDDS
jgi:hypothetical protein